jgi:hypothetical protein
MHSFLGGNFKSPMEMVMAIWGREEREEMCSGRGEEEWEDRDEMWDPRAVIGNFPCQAVKPPAPGG